MSGHHRWLKDEVGRWQAEGLVDSALAQRILARYPAAAERNWGRIVFSAIGAVLVGLGVILFFAYNWQDIPKAAKLALVFGALIAAHGSALWLARTPQPNRGLAEGLHTLGTMLFGAGIWLVAQIYHIDEHYPNAFLAWSLGALALAWALPSIVQALLALFLVAFWAGVELFDFHRSIHGAPLLVVLGVLPLAWWRRSSALLFWALAVLFVVTAFALGGIDGRGVVPLLFMMGAAALFAGAAAPATAWQDAEGPLCSVGLLVVLVCGYVLSFREAALMLGRIDVAKPHVAIYFGAAGAALLAAVTGCIALFMRGALQRVDRYRRWQLALLGIGLAVLAAGMLNALGTLGAVGAEVRGRASSWAIALPFNAVVLGLAAVLILEGSARLRPRLVGAGCFVFAVVTVSRYADLFGSLLARAAVFIALGAGLFFVGNFYARQRRRAQEMRP